jgi:AcrR family transcriptional regulator
MNCPLTGAILDRRQERTRQAHRQAFIALVAERRYEDIAVTNIVERANVGKSTFYEHFRSKDELLSSLMDRMLRDLADAARGELEAGKLHFLMDHFWANRRLGRVVFGKSLAPTIRRRLAAMIEQPGNGTGAPDGTPSPKSVMAASGQVGLLHSWLSGECVATPEDMAATLASGWSQ